MKNAGQCKAMWYPGGCYYCILIAGHIGPHRDYEGREFPEERAHYRRDGRKNNAGDGPDKTSGVGKGDDAPGVSPSPLLGDKSPCGASASADSQGRGLDSAPDPAPQCKTCSGTDWITTSYPNGPEFECSCPDCNDGAAELLDEGHARCTSEEK